MAISLEAVGRGELNERTARQVIWRELGSEGTYRTVYAALCRWTWRALIESRLDDALKAWHRLLLDVAARIAVQAPKKLEGGDRPRLDAVAASERLRGMADLVRLSIEAADASDLDKFTSRAHVLSILRLLTSHAGGALERDKIKSELGLRDANLSRVLTLLAANGLVERMPRGKEAIFRATQRGMGIVEASLQKTKPRFHETWGRATIEFHASPVSLSEHAFVSCIYHKDIVVGMREEASSRMYRPETGIYLWQPHIEVARR